MSIAWPCFPQLSSWTSCPRYVNFDFRARNSDRVGGFGKLQRATIGGIAAHHHQPPLVLKRIFTPIVLNNYYNSMACVDTASDITVISPKMATALRLKPVNDNSNVYTADGSKLNSSGYVMVNLTVLGYTFHQRRVCVAPLNYSNECLLGLDILTHLPATIDLKSRELRLQSSSSKVDKELQWKVTDGDNEVLQSYLSHLDPQHAKAMENILLKNGSSVDDWLSEWRPAMVKSHRIITEGRAPVHQHPYRVSSARREEIQSSVTEMLEKGIIRPSSSAWASPVILVPKKNGKLRFATDFRRLNSLTTKDRFPLPRIDDLIDRLHDANWFTTLDLASGFWQIPLAEEDKHKTAFVTPDGQWEYNVMPFGLCNAPSAFQRSLNETLGELRWKTCLVYMDDIIVYGSNFEEMLENLNQVLSRLNKVGFRIKLNKCSFGRQEVTYLGYIVGNGRLKPSSEKLQAVQDFPTPQCANELQKFLGLASYYRKFIKGFSEITNSLRALTKRDAPWTWNQDQSVAFELLKSKLIQPPALCTFDPTLPTEIRTDASGHGLGAILIQRTLGNQVKGVVAYASRHLSKAEKNYSTTEKEALAVVWAVTEKFRPYVEGQTFNVITDHAALASQFKVKDPSHRLLRFITKLQGYDYTIKYNRGRYHSDADALSRSPITVSSPRDDGDQVCSIALDIALSQDHDPKWKNIKNILCKPISKRTARDKNAAKNFLVLNGNLYFSDKKRLVLPQKYRVDVLKECHESLDAGHFDFRRTYESVKHRFYWPSLHKDVKNFVRSCKICQRMNKTTENRRGRMQPMTAGAPLDCIGIDFEGPFKISSNRHKYIITAIDYHSRFAFAAPVIQANAHTACRFLHDIIIRQFGPPKVIISDRGTPFMSEAFKNLLDTFGIEHRPSTAYHPQTNGLCERWNGVLVSIIKKYVQNHKQWSQYVSSAVWSYNVSNHAITGATPYSLLFGRNPRTSLDLKYNLPRKAVNKRQNQQSANQRTAAARRKQARRYDGERQQTINYTPGTKVWWEPVILPKAHQSRKFMPVRDGPFTVIKQMSANTYMLEGKKGEFVANVDRLRAVF